MSQTLTDPAAPPLSQYNAPSQLRRPATNLPPQLTCPDDVYRLCRRQRGFKQEVLRVICMTDQHRVIRSVTVSRGTLGTFITHAREVYRPAILACAEAIFLVHIHPNGDPRPSSADLALTRWLCEAGHVNESSLIANHLTQLSIFGRVRVAVNPSPLPTHSHTIPTGW